MSFIDFFSGLAKGMLGENRGYVWTMYRGEIDKKVFHHDYIVLSGYRVYYEKFDYIFDLYREVFLDRLYDFELAGAKASPVIFDLGANIGMATLRFKKLYPGTKIVCFEPQDRAFELLSRNVKENGLDGVTLNHLAVSDHDGEIVFYSEPMSGSCPGAGVIHVGGFAESRMRCVRLSGYIDEHVDLLKMDIEGSELSVLSELAVAGKLQMIDRIFLEYHPDTDSFVQIVTLLRDNGFKWRVYSPHRFEPETDVSMIYATR